MRLLDFSVYDIYLHFRKNKSYYIIFGVFAVVAIVISIIFIAMSDRYLSLLVSGNKNLYKFINGTASGGEIFFSRVKSFIFPLIIVLLLGLWYESSLLSYIVFTYQFSVFILSIAGQISVYYLSGVLTSIFLIIPINLIFFATLIFLSVTCIDRAMQAKRFHNFFEGFNGVFFIKIAICFLMVIVLSIIVAFFIPAILKSSIFLIF